MLIMGGNWLRVLRRRMDGVAESAVPPVSRG